MSETESLQPSLYIQTCIIWPLSIVATVLRFIARRQQHAEFWWDDWLILAATLINIGFTSISFLVFHYGLGKHYETLPPDGMMRFLKTFYVGQILYTTILATVKWSILALYWRLFHEKKSFQYPWYALLGLSTAWFLATLWGCIFSCIPIYWSWSDTGAPAGNCIDKKAFYLAVSGVNSVTDVSLLILPIWFVVQLNYYTKGKILCCIAFLTGGFVCIVTFVRIAVLTHTDFFAADQTWEEVRFAEWTNVEVNVAIISACLPCFGRFFAGTGSRASSTVVDHSPVGSSLLRRSMTNHEDAKYGNVLLEIPRRAITTAGGPPQVEFQGKIFDGMNENGQRTTRDNFEVESTV